jgi:hypothetical protein
VSIGIDDDVFRIHELLPLALRQHGEYRIIVNFAYV